MVAGGGRGGWQLEPLGEGVGVNAVIGNVDNDGSGEVNVSISFSFVKIRIFDFGFGLEIRIPTPSRVELIDKRSIFGLETTINR